MSDNNLIQIAIGINKKQNELLHQESDETGLSISSIVRNLIVNYYRGRELL